MKRRNVISGLAAIAALQLCLAGAAMAASFSEKIVQQLRSQGFDNIVVERTWLGRDRILAERSDARREVIVNPNTGEILRDLWLSKSGDSVQVGRITDDEDYDDDGDNSGHGGDDDDDDDDDDDSDDDDSDDDDDDSEDNSGSGSDDD